MAAWNDGDILTTYGSGSERVEKPSSDASRQFQWKRSHRSVMRKLHLWYRKCGRDLPWRQTSDPYAILISEYMLQQTQVETAREYFERWMNRFPNLQALAAASEDEILAMWQGLGYYARARNLHRAARALNDLPQFPEAPDDLRKLPGIGEYTAHAVAAFAFDDCVPVIDTNIARVLTRIFDYSEPVDTPSGMRVLREMASSLLPVRGGGRLHNSALMELGALICKPRQPLCHKCPVRCGCLSQNPEAQPVKRPRTAIKKVIDNRLFLCDGKSIWLTRSTGKWWNSLWILPEAKVVPPRSYDHSIKFSVTNHRILMRIWRESPPNHMEYQKIALKNLVTLPMPSPHRRGIAAMLATDISHF